MKIIHPLLLCATILLSLASCAKESEAGDGRNEQDVLITLSAGTRGDNNPEETGIHNGDGIDSYISSLRVLGYRVSDNTLAFNQFVTSFSTPGYTAQVTVKTGTYHIVFIANEKSGGTDAGSLHQKLVGITPAVNNTESYLEGLSLPSSAFDPEKNIPMIRRTAHVTVKGDNRIVVNGAYAANPWPVEMERLGIRVELSLKLTASEWGNWKTNGSVTFSNLPDQVFLFPDAGYPTISTANSRSFTHATPNTPNETDNGLSVFHFSRIILPASYFTPVTAAEQAMVLTTQTNITRSGKISTGKSEYGYTLPRNQYLKITASILDDELNLSAAVSPWADESVNGDL